MFERPWSKPVLISLSSHTLQAVDGQQAALVFLDGDWPTRKGRHYQAAKATCEAALARLTSAEAAREVFISASIEAAVPFR